MSNRASPRGNPKFGPEAWCDMAIPLFRIRSVRLVRHSNLGRRTCGVWPNECQIPPTAISPDHRTAAGRAGLSGPPVKDIGPVGPGPGLAVFGLTSDSPAKMSNDRRFINLRVYQGGLIEALRGAAPIL